MWSGCILQRKPQPLTEEEVQEELQAQLLPIVTRKTSHGVSSATLKEEGEVVVASRANHFLD